MTEITLYETESMTLNSGQGSRVNENYFGGTDR